jgi:hypothetical protein
MAEAQNNAVQPGTEVVFKVDFKGEDGKTPALSYDKAQNSFTLSEGPLDVGTLEDLGTSIAGFFGGSFPDTTQIPVIGAIMNKLAFRIKTFDYTGKTETDTDTFDLEIESVPSKPGDAMSIGKAVVTDIDIKVSKKATALTS